MADNRLTGGLRGCVEAFLEYIPHVTCPSILAERMLCALSSQSALQSLRHSTGFPLRVICTQNSGGQVPAEQYRCWPGWYLLKPWTGCNWFPSADFTLTRLLQLQTLSQAFLEHRQPHLSPAGDPALVTSTKYPSLWQPEVQQLLSWHRDNSSPETISSICLQKAKPLHALRMWSSLVSSWKGAPGSHCLSSARTKCLQMPRNAGMSKWSATKHLRKVSYREIIVTANRKEIFLLWDALQTIKYL